jgi:molecular chaperone GrpE
MSDHDKTLEDRPEQVSEHGNGEASPGAHTPGDGAPVVDRADAPDAPTSAAAARALAEALGNDADEDALRGDVDELVAVAAQRDEYLALAQRTQADFENYRKRVAREAATAQERGIAGLAKELLPALDNLDRAIEAAPAQDPLLEGVRLVRSELAAGLARAGIESYSPMGEEFDPSLHEAVATAPQPEGGSPSGTVVEVYEAGYRLGGNVIRPARVVVAA